MISDMPEGAKMIGPDGPINEITNTRKADRRAYKCPIESLKKKMD